MFKADLKKLGLGDKEAAVYLAALELGPSPVQIISRKSKVARATTYMVLEALMEFGLVTKQIRDKRTVFAAEAPSRLKWILKQQESAIHERHQYLEELLPRLQATVQKTNGYPRVRYYEGLGGVEEVQREMIRCSRSGDMWYGVLSIDYYIKVYGSIDFIKDSQRIVRGVKARSIFTTKSEAIKKKLLNAPRNHNVERKYIPPEKFSDVGNFAIYNDRVSLVSLREGKEKDISVIVIESDVIATMMREIFEMLWDSLD